MGPIVLVISGMTLDYVGTDVCASFGDSRSTVGELFYCLSGRTRFAHCFVVFNGILQPPEAASDVISGRFVRLIVLDGCVKFRDLCLNHSREIPPEAVTLKSMIQWKW